MDKNEIRAQVLTQLDEACKRLKKRIDHLTVESQAQIIDPYNLRMVAENGNGDLYVACDLMREFDRPPKIGFCFAPLAKVLDILTFTPDNEDTLNAVQREFTAKEPPFLVNIRFISYREFCGKLAAILTEGLKQTNEVIANINQEKADEQQLTNSGNL